MFNAELIELLIGISGVAVAIAGFSGIAIVLKARDDIAWARLKSSTIKGMLETSLTVSLFALFPLGLGYFAADSNTGLAVLTIVFGLWHAWILYAAMRREHTTAILQPWKSRFVSIVSVGVILAKLIVGIGMFSKYLWAAYLIGLFWLLIMAVVNFCLLLYSTLESGDEK